MRKAAFLDRDGVINVDHAYVFQWEDFEFVTGSVEAMRRLREAGFALVIVTNQSGLARGMYTEDQYQELTSLMCDALAQAGAEVDAVYHCPHHPEGLVPSLAIRCDCRKPEPGMLLRAARELGLSLADSFLVGDKPTDLAAARAAGVGRAFMVHSEPAGDDGPEASLADGHFKTLSDCVSALIGELDACP